MSRYYCDAKRTVEQCKSIDVFFLAKHNYFSGYRSGGLIWTNREGQETASMGITVSTMDEMPYARLTYIMTDCDSGIETRYDYKVYLTTTPCNFGGLRYWFLCPDCNKRVGYLYRPPRHNRYRCRHCNNLSYESRNESYNGYIGFLGLCLATHRKHDKLESQIKRYYYNNKPTRKYRKLLRIQKRLND